MLIDNINRPCREMAEQAGPVVTVPHADPAANVDRLGHAEMQARRQRRRRRMQRAGSSRFNGWTVRTW